MFGRVERDERHGRNRVDLPKSPFLEQACQNNERLCPGEMFADAHARARTEGEVGECFLGLLLRSGNPAIQSQVFRRFPKTGVAMDEVLAGQNGRPGGDDFTPDLHVFQCRTFQPQAGG